MRHLASLSALILFAIGCGSSDDSASKNHAGTGAVSGAGGSGAHAGTGGSNVGGSGESGGSAGAPSGGDGGVSGDGGTAGTGGAPGLPHWIPGPSEAGFDAALEKKALSYDRQFRVFSSAPFGLSLDAFIPSASD